MPDCFISYSKVDKPVADVIYKGLNQVLDVFMDSPSINLGAEWEERIRSNLTASSCVILLATKASCESKWVLDELGMARGTNKTVIPVLWGISPSDLPESVRRYQAFRLKNLSQPEVQSLCKAIERVVREKRAKGSPVGSDAAALLKNGIKLIEARSYEAAIDVLKQSIKFEPLAPATNYYLALALLRGGRPKALHLSEADEVCRYLATACNSDSPQAHYFYLWAFVKFDFYVTNGLFVREPDVEELLISAQDYPFDQNAIDQMSRHADLDDTLRSLGLI